MKKNRLNTKRVLISLVGFVLVYAMVAKCTSNREERTLKKHCGEFVTEDFEPINWEKPSEKDIGKNIAKEVSRDVDSLINNNTNPQKKYGQSTMYCTATATHAVRDAQQRMNCPVDVFENMPQIGMINGDKAFKFFRTNYENKIPGLVKVITNPTDTTKIAEMEEVFNSMNPGAMVRYYGHYPDKRTHRHTQTYLGTGYCNDGCFVPNKHGKPVMAAGYNNSFKYLESDVMVYYHYLDAECQPILDSIVIIDIPKLMAYKAKMQQK